MTDLLALLALLYERTVLYHPQDLAPEDASRLVDAGWAAPKRFLYSDGVVITDAGIAAMKRGDVGERHAGLRPRQR